MTTARPLAAALLALAAAIAPAQTYIPIPRLTNPNGALGFATGLNHDGSLVVGDNYIVNSLNRNAFRFENGTTLVNASCNLYSAFTATTPSGLAVGYTSSPTYPGALAVSAWWNAPSNCMTTYPQPTDADFSSSFANGVAANGSVAVGYSLFTIIPNQTFSQRPWKWTTATHTPLPLPHGATGGMACDASADGSVIVGEVNSFLGYTRYRATRWTSAGPTVLGWLPNGTASVARAVSADGSVIVGESDAGGATSTQAGPMRAFRWTQQTGMVNLGMLAGSPPTSGSYAEAVSRDGSVVFGYDDGPIPRTAFMWREDLGMVSFRWLLDELNVPSLGYHPFGILAISDDSTAVAGYHRIANDLGAPVEAFVVRNLPPLCGPLIYRQPSSQTICAGGSVTLRVRAYVPGQASFQWFKWIGNYPLGFAAPVADGNGISGATSADITFSPANASHSGLYFCQINGGCTHADSQLVTLTVQSAPVVTQQPPLSLFPCGAGPQNITITAANAASYQWQAEVPFMSNNFVNLTNGVFSGIGAINGANTPSLTITDFFFGGHTAYRCRVTNDCGSTFSLASLVIPCFADFNCDGQVDFFDYLDYADAYNNDDPAADINRDGIVDFFDYLDFVNFYSEGCD